MANFDEFLEKLEQQLLSQASIDPTFVYSDRNFLIKQQMKLLDLIKTLMPQVNSVTTWTATASTAPNRSFPVIPLDKKKMISIDDILQAGPDFVHKGKFFLCRSIMPDAKLGAINYLVVDDPTGQRCLIVALYNFSGNIHPGTILAIMHPWFNKSDIDGSAAVQVGNPQHVRLMDGSEAVVKSLAWKAPLPKESGVTEVKKPEDDLAWEGNRHFEQKNYPGALVAYSKAIEEHPRVPILYSNRALTYLKLEKPEKALEDTEIGLKLQPSHSKLLYRKGKALIGLKRYEEAASFLENAGKEHEEVTKEKAFSDLVKVSKRMVDESKNGNYDIVEMIEEAKRSKLLENHAEYYALDKFEVRDVPGKRPILVAKQKIPMGTLLMASKAFVYFAVSERTKSMEISIDCSARCTFSPLFSKACQKLSNNPEQSDDFYKLYAGKALGRLENADPSNPMDMDRIVGIIRYNTFSAGERLIGGGQNAGDSGIWIWPSFVGHSCVDYNCFRYMVGDFMFIRAIKNINPGEELVTEYVFHAVPYEERRQALRDGFDIECSCRLCQADRNDPEEIRKALNEIRAMCYAVDNVPIGSKLITVLRGLLADATKYRPEKELNFAAEYVQGSLAVVLMVDQPDSSLKMFEELFEIRTRANDPYPALIYARGLARLNFRLGDVDQGAEWIKVGKKLAIILYGDERMMDLIEE